MITIIVQLSKPIVFICILTAILLLAATLLLAGGTPPEYASSWRDQEIVIDGSNNDWRHPTCYLDDLKGVVSACNDDEYLYLCLLSADRDVMRQMMMSGMTMMCCQQQDEKEETRKEGKEAQIANQ